MRFYILLIFIFLWSSVLPASSFSQSEIEWAPAVTGTLYKGNSLSNGEYTVKAVEFASPVKGFKNFKGEIVPETPVEPSVLLEIYKNGVFIREIVMTLQSEAYKDPDYEVMVSVAAFTAKSAREWVYEYYKPWAKISISLRGKPKLEYTVNFDKTTYTSNTDQTITAKVTIKNSGKGFAQFVDVIIDTAGLNLRGGDLKELHKYYVRMNKGTSQSFDIIMLVPKLIDQKSYNFSINSKYYDLKDIEYNSIFSKSITVSPQQNYFVISKAVRDRMYLKNTATVMITVSNGGIYNIYNIHINDSVHENFDLKTDPPLEWDIPMLKPGEDWRTTYNIKPMEASLTGFKIPAAIADFTVNNKPYTASSKTTTIVVNGPKMILNKTVSKSVVNISELVTVTVSIKNIGDIGTRFEAKDILPDNVNLAGGSTSLVNWMDPNTVQKFSYNITIENEGEIELPSAVLNYTNVEYRGTTREVKSSDKPVITIVDPAKPRKEDLQKSNSSTNPSSTSSESNSKTTPPKEGSIEPTPMTPGFGIGFTIIILLFTAALRRK
jgi:uncharacterized repeat protein (TIGR01451 family)